MEPKFKTSFIPKRSLATAPGRKRKSVSIAIVPLIALILFLGAVGLTFGIFLYQQILIANLDSKKEKLEQAREALKDPLIDELVRLDTRIKSANEILSSHLILTALFDLLEERTLANVRFTDFSYDISEDNTVQITMGGVARNFNAIAVQSEVFTSDRLVQNPIFSNLGVDQDGRVTFHFTASVDPRVFSYILSLDEDVPLEQNEG